MRYIQDQGIYPKCCMQFEQFPDKIDTIHSLQTTNLLVWLSSKRLHLDAIPSKKPGEDSRNVCVEDFEHLRRIYKDFEIVLPFGYYLLWMCCWKLLNATIWKLGLFRNWKVFRRWIFLPLLGPSLWFLREKCFLFRLYLGRRLEWKTPKNWVFS